MNLTKLSETYESEYFQKSVKMCMLQKVAYWSATLSASELTPEQEQQRAFSLFALGSQDAYARKVGGLAICQPCIIEAVDATDTNIEQAVNLVLSGNLEFLI